MNLRDEDVCDKCGLAWLASDECYIVHCPTGRNPRYWPGACDHIIGYGTPTNCIDCRGLGCPAVVQRHEAQR